MQPTAGRGSPQRITALPDESGSSVRSAAHTLKEPRQSSLAPVQPASELNLRPARRRSVNEHRAPAPKRDHALPALARELATSGRSGKALCQSRETGSTPHRHVRSSRHPRVCHPDRPPSSLERAAVPRALAVMAGPSSPVSLSSHPKASLQLVLRRPPGCRWSAPGSRDRFCAVSPTLSRPPGSSLPRPRARKRLTWWAVPDRFNRRSATVGRLRAMVWSYRHLSRKR